MPPFRAGLASALMIVAHVAAAPAHAHSSRDASRDWFGEDEAERRSNRDARRRTAAVDACREEALADAESYGIFGRVSRIDGVDQSGPRFRVRGVVVDESHPRYKRKFRFTCVARDGSVESFGFRDPIRRSYRD